MKYLLRVCTRNISARFLYILRLFDRITFSYWDDQPNERLENDDQIDVLAAFELAKSNINNSILEKINDWGITPPSNFINQLGYITQSSKKKTPLNIDHGYLLYGIVSKIAQHRKKINIFETGTARGFSSVVMSRACADNECLLNLITLDVLPHNIPIYWNSITDLDGKRSRKNLLRDYQKYTDSITFIQANTRINLDRIHVDRINFAFLDGAHKYEDIIKESSYVVQRQEVGDVILYDDYNETMFPGIVKGVNEICEAHNYNLTILGGKDGRFYAICEKM